MPTTVRSKRAETAPRIPVVILPAAVLLASILLSVGVAIQSHDVSVDISVQSHDMDDAGVGGAASVHSGGGGGDSAGGASGRARILHLLEFKSWHLDRRERGLLKDSGSVYAQSL